VKPEDLLTAKQRLLSDLVKLKNERDQASTAWAARQATNSIEGTRMLLDALERQLERSNSSSASSTSTSTEVR